MAKTKKKEVESNDYQQKEKSNQKDFIQAHGRRKTATARVRLFQKPGAIIVNGLAIEQYFPGEIAKARYGLPFITTKTLGKTSATIKVAGSGKNGQLDAVIHALSRALIKLNPNFRQSLKPVGLLTRDPRAKERRKYGLAQKARKGKQSPKR